MADASAELFGTPGTAGQAPTLAPTGINTGAAEPTAPIGNPLEMTPEEFKQHLTGLSQEMSNPGKETDRHFFNNLYSIALTRALEVAHPAPTDPRYPPTPGLEANARIFEAQKLRSRVNAIKEIEKKHMALRAMQQMFPEEASDAGITDDLFNRIHDVTSAGMHKGWQGVQFLVNNLDRARGAAAAFTLSKIQGGTIADARRKAWDAFRGSSKGFKLNPEELGPSWREILRAAGLDDDWTTATLGIGMDVILDPVNLLGLGVAHSGVRIGTNQVLNEAGRTMLGTLMRSAHDEAIVEHGVASALDLSAEARMMAQEKALSQMRTIINADYDTAAKYLDMGGLKVAGISLFGKAHLTREPVLYAGKGGHMVEQWSAKGIPSIYTGKLMRGMDYLGNELTSAAGSSVLKDRLGRFLQGVPRTIRELNDHASYILNRTPTVAGEEYKLYKQLHYDDRLGWEQARVLDTVNNIFAGIDKDTLDKATFAIDQGEVPQFLASVAQERGAQYAASVQKAIDDTTHVLDASLIDQVKAGFFARSWDKMKRAKLVAWIEDPMSVMLTPEELTQFTKIRRENYVLHYYHNKGRATEFFKRPVTPRAPSIVDPSTNQRAFPTLKEAQDAGFTPEINLKALTAIRLNSARRSIATNEFLEGVARDFGQNISQFTGRARALEMMQTAGEFKPIPKWRDVLNMRRTASGGLPMETAAQISLARDMAHEAKVPVEAVIPLDDAAKREFLAEKLRQGNIKAAERAWAKYVEEPSNAGLYDGFGLAPAREMGPALAAAKDVRDPFYTSWTKFTAGGLADPRVLSQVHLPTPIAKDLSRLRLQLLDPEWRGVLGLYDKTQYWWKRAVTMPWPAFHLRNKWTNVLNSMLDVGIVGTLDRSTMWDILHGKEGTLRTAMDESYSYKQLRDAMRRLGVVNNTYRRIDVTQMIDELAGRGEGTWRAIARKYEIPLSMSEEGAAARQALNMPSGISVLHPFQGGQDLALTIENADRMQLFLATVKRGASFQEAANRVRTFLFDYDDISAVESQIVRRFLFPFWTWTRKNLGLQLKHGILPAPISGGFRLNPAATLGKLARGLSAEPPGAVRSDLERSLLPDALMDAFGIRLQAAPQLSKWLMNIDVPVNDLNRFWDISFGNTLRREWLSNLSPYVRGALESLLDYDFYKGKQNIEFRNDKREYDFVLKLPKSFQDFLQVKQVIRRDQKTVRINRDRYMAMMAGLAFTGTRLYSYAGRFLDSHTNMGEFAWGFFTGTHISYNNPAEQLRTTAESAALGQDGSMLMAYRDAWNQFKQQLMVKHADEAEKMQFLREIDKAVNTPEFPDEVEDKIDVDKQYD